ncbi:FAD-dependent oxidoreductase [Natronobiforma cellulositropha]|uniref:FAD-dependent oxidoreductase n=1 Tax=Natronobiforma cellulositropha TaxID=1679076 RepID=UPI0021D5904B|nr:FAD-dependent oxidoreductase [Natronobiforma cellulositropha]
MNNDQCVVVGGGIAGLCAARVLADYAERVVLVEKDPLPDEPVLRRGVPQMAQPHALLEAGREVLEELFPGFCEDVLSSGGLMIDGASDMEYFAAGGLLAQGPNQHPMYCASRALFEGVVRRRVATLDNVACRPERRLVEVDLDDGAVCGVRIAGPDGQTEALEADVVVDATGRTSKTPAWLEENGYERPPVDELSVEVTYTTTVIDRPRDCRRLVFVPPAPPRTRGGVAIPIEDGQWHLAVQGMYGDDAPTDAESVRAFAESLPTGELGRLGADAWEDRDLTHYPFPSSIRRRYEDLERRPDGLVVVGDALASINPLYGQGMSIAALEALALHHVLAEGDNVSGRYFETVRSILDPMWETATANDLAYDRADGTNSLGTNLFNRYVGRLLRKAHDDGTLTDAYIRVLLLKEQPTSLLRPSVVRRVLFSR